jgi:hypothetical protein
MHLPQHIMDLHDCTHMKQFASAAEIIWLQDCSRSMRTSAEDVTQLWTHKLNIIKETILNIIRHKSNRTSLEKLKLNNPFNAQKILYVCAVLLGRTAGTMRKLVQSTMNFVSHISAIWVLGFSVRFNFLG